MTLNKQGFLYNKIPELRMSKGLSQKELADLLSVSRQTIASLEKNKYNPSLKLAYEISLFFGRNIQDVFFYVCKREE